MLEATIKDLERLAKHFVVNGNGCWVWQSAKFNGYASTSLRSKNYRGHRLMYLILRGNIPDDKVCDHLCREIACINPYHIELVSQKENVNRGAVPKKICARGHPRTPDNLYVYKRTGLKECIACRKITHRKRYLKEKAKALAKGN